MKDKRKTKKILKRRAKRKAKAVNHPTILTQFPRKRKERKEKEQKKNKKKKNKTSQTRLLLQFHTDGYPFSLPKAEKNMHSRRKRRKKKKKRSSHVALLGTVNSPGGSLPLAAAAGGSRDAHCSRCGCCKLQRDMATRRHGDKATWRHGDMATWRDAVRCS